MAAELLYQPGHNVVRAARLQLRQLQQLLLLLVLLPSWLLSTAEAAIVNGVGATPAMGWNSWNTFRHVQENSTAVGFVLGKNVFKQHTIWLRPQKIQNLGAGNILPAPVCLTA